MTKVRKRIFTSLLAIMLIAAFSVSAWAASWTSTANGNSEAVKYTLTTKLVRTGEKTATVKWTLKAKWAKSKEGHGSPSTIKATVYCGKKKSTVTVKKKGSNTLNKNEGSFKIDVGSKTSTVKLGLSASGSGSYQTSRTVSYTYYTTTTVYFKVDRYSGARTEISYSQFMALVQGSSVSLIWAGKETVSVAHTGTRTVTDTHKTNSGTLARKNKTFKGLAQWYYVSYDAVGGSPTPKTHGFIGGKSTEISKTVPKYWCEDIKKYGYTNKGWSTTKYALNTGTAQYQGGDTYSDKADLKLYAVYQANKIGRIVFHANGGNADSVPAPIDKYYKVNVTLPSTIPTYPETENKGVRHFFLRWNTKADGTGMNFTPNGIFNLNANPHEPIPQDDINLYAIWYEGTDKLNPLGETPEDDTTPGIRYIGKESLNSIGEDSKWRSGVRQQQLEDSLGKDGSNQAKSTYDADGNKIK